MKNVSIWMVMGIMALALGCDGVDRVANPMLKPLANCQGVEDAVRQAALHQMNQTLELNLDRAMSGSGGGYCGPGSYDDSYNGAPAPSAGASSGKTSGGERGASQTSGTNNQVSGVDEADFIKNDNKNIYVLGGNFFRIIKAWPAARTAELSATAIEGDPKKLFVWGKRALVYSSLPMVAASSGSAKSSSGSYSGSTNECTYGYGCTFTGDGRPTLLTLFDISDLTKPVKIREIRTTGSYVNARRVGGAVYTVISSPAVTFPNLRYWPANMGYCGNSGNSGQSRNDIGAAFEQLRAANALIIMTTPLDTLLPQVEDTLFSGGKQTSSTQVLAACDGFYKSTVSTGTQFTTLLGVDMTSAKKAKADTIVSKPGPIYASATALYMSVPLQNMSSYRWGGYGLDSQEEVSTVHKFNLQTKQADLLYVGSGVVKGRVLNQFAMDEHNGYLRIATTTGRLPSAKVHSTLSVLQDLDDHLHLVGQLDNLAPKEDIRSMRFDGGRAFMVTFKKTDPLFTFDLTTPSAPRVLAELKIPGFSTYMHMMDKEHLLTIGYDANDQGSFAWFTGVMLQIFDVRNMSSPRLVFKEVIGTRGSSSVALNNHLAFTYFAPKNLLALPMTVCEGSNGGGSYGKDMTFSGLMVYDVTATGGFNLRGKVAHKAGSGVTCSNWWTRANSQVKRSIIMDDYVYSVSGEQIKVNHRNNLSVDLASVKIN